MIPPSHPVSGQWLNEIILESQWRDRAGFAPGFPFHLHGRQYCRQDLLIMYLFFQNADSENSTACIKQSNS
ncbi:hypothetical protein ABB08_03115 [Paenibacillus larvae]|nr:hypothetical protein [Paenibacillus larvae]